MDEALVFPSPNWFQVSGIAVSADGWIFYGGPSHSLCVLEPLSDSVGVLDEKLKYTVHFISRAHTEKIVSVDVSPEWSTNKCLVTGSEDGTLKYWKIEKENNKTIIKSTMTHDIHKKYLEGVVGLGFATEDHILSCGSFGTICKWNINTNLVNTYTNILKSLKPLCFSCSPHIPFHIAIGTKQGVVMVIDVKDKATIIYKMRANDDEILNISWCPQYEVAIYKALEEKPKKLRGKQNINKQKREAPNDTGITKELPVDSFDEANNTKTNLDALELTESKVLNDDNVSNNSELEETVIVEDDPFDVYKDPEDDEFGHKKYQSEEFVVVDKKDCPQLDYLDECEKLKADMLKMKENYSIQSLVEAIDETHLTSKSTETIPVCKETSKHIEKHLLASISRHGLVRIWSKGGRLVAKTETSRGGKKYRMINPTAFSSLLWYKPDTLLIADTKAQLLKCNPLKLEWDDKLHWDILHLHHKRSLFSIVSNAPRVQTQDMDPSSWVVWTASQERSFICYSVEEDKLITTYTTCGGFVYTIDICPYDATRLALSVGDGTVRTIDLDTTLEDENKLVFEVPVTYWSKVQGKVLTVAWHPTKENLLAFATGESRVGLLDTRAPADSPARTLKPAPGGGVYSLCWGDMDDLYAASGGKLVCYEKEKTDDPTAVAMKVDGHPVEVTCIRWDKRGVLVGTAEGSVLLASRIHVNVVEAVAYVFSKMIYTAIWHPQQVSSSTTESPLKDLIAVCSADKSYEIAILKYEQIENGKKLSTLKRLKGHSGMVQQLAWNPHMDGMLLSTAHETTVRVWDVAKGECVGIFGGHSPWALSAAWSPHPTLPTLVLSGGADCCVRVWDSSDHPKHLYTDVSVAKKRRNTKKNKGKAKEIEPTKEQTNKPVSEEEEDNELATNVEAKARPAKDYLFPLLQRNMSLCPPQALRKTFFRYLQKIGHDTGEYESYNDKTADTNFANIFGSANELTEYLEEELEKHLSSNRVERWVMVQVLRGRLDEMVQMAAKRDLLCPFILSITPGVSFKYWKDVTHLYLQQISRLQAKGKDDTSAGAVTSRYGGSVFRKMALQLSVHDVKGAVNTLNEAYLFKEAYILCRIRYMENMLDEIVESWAKHYASTGNFAFTALLNIVLGKIPEAARILANSTDEGYLSVAAELAKFAGQKCFTEHIIEKQSQVKKEDETPEETKLPTRAEIAMKRCQQGDDGNHSSINEQLEELTLEDTENIESSKNAE